MYILPRTILLLALGACLASAEIPGAGSQVRDWTSADGKTLSGRMLGIDDQSVTVQLAASGKPAKVPFTRLSAKDQAFIVETGWRLPKPWSKWPNDIKMGIADADVRLVSSDGRYVYHSPHFEFVSEAELAQTPARDIARMFETTYSLLKASPWGILAKPPKGERFKAELYANRESYIKAGGPPQSAGVYLLQKKVFMVPFETLGLKETPSGWQRSEEYSTKTLIHELTHMLMDDALMAMPTWLAEGCAEYMELMPMKIGTFSPGSHLAALKEHHSQQRNFDLLKTLTMSRETWDRGGIETSPSPPSRPDRFGPVITGRTGQTTMGLQEEILSLYEAGLLLTYYFIHFDGAGDAARLQRFISACVKNSERLEEHIKKGERYNEDVEAFKRHPEVTVLPDGRCQYPATMKPPSAPAWPYKGSPEQLHVEDLELLLDGRTPADLIEEIKLALEKAQIRYSPKAGRGDR
ncbi:hypothetical protein OJ996_22735 [Luteolibacter sp. GHJ8]|jgi:hypothetical protein|uniref:SLA1 homology domain-containing protein n=1 Tax=Luteolibacter rhizosphaerae TaxID=2989719 RepID=A0ABT3G991_9BACT|nr:hypothetical protein [Luteolibacter rhizosphaerae]MCW1916423.1 hypothetical protein [Luteolibacter rhizosphaerae]